MNNSKDILKKLLSCRGCEFSDRINGYKICKLMDESFYPEGPLAAIAQQICIKEDKFELYIKYIELIENEQKLRMLMQQTVDEFNEQ